MKTVADLIVGVDAVVDGTETAVNAAARTLRKKDFEILVLVDVGQTFLDALTTELVLGSETIVGLALNTGHAIAFPLLLEQSRLPFIVGTMFWRVCAWEPIHLVCFECFVECRVHQIFYTVS